MHTCEILKNHTKSMMTIHVWHKNNKSSVFHFQVKVLADSIHETKIPNVNFSNNSF